LAMAVMPDRDSVAAVVWDAEHGEFVRVPGTPDGYWRLLALAADGRQLLLHARHGAPPYPNMTWLDGLCLFDLASGGQRWFSAMADGRDRVGALSPDGATIATLSTLPDPAHPGDMDTSLAAVGLTDVATGRRRRVWATPAGWSAESCISWSPDGQMLAVTYTVWVEERQDGYCESAVIDLSGRVRWQQLDAMIPSASNGAWLSDRHLVVLLDGEERRELLVVDVSAGTRRVVCADGISGPVAAFGDRIIRGRSELLDEDGWLMASDFDLSNARPFITVPRPTRPVDVSHYPTGIDLIRPALGDG